MSARSGEKKPVLWGYEGDVGPSQWQEHFPDAKGKRQSPVAIDTSAVVVDKNLKPLDVKYDSHLCSSITNNGHTFCVTAKSEDCNLTGGPLTDKYRLLQFHSHWGSDDTKGAEHTIDGKQHAAELHLVHWNTDKFTSPGEAIKNDKGIAVLTAFIKVGKEHKGWNQVLAHFKNISDVNGSSNMDEDFNPRCLLPENLTDYWTYEGSLTTPPCYESVRFIMFKEVVELSKDQLAQFRSLMTTPLADNVDTCPHLVDNFRPLQPLNGRIITASFES